MDSEQPLLDGLLSDTREVVQELLGRPLQAPSALRSQLQAFAQGLQADNLPLTADVHTAEVLLGGCEALLDAIGDSPPEREHRLTQVAVQYFVLEEDGDDDMDSCFGFDDDVEVFNAVVSALHHEHLALSP